MKVSIITATYNSSATIEHCIQSVIGQDYPEIEYIIVDGGSTDETISVIKDWQKRDSRIQWVSEKDKGIYDALNKGVTMATGDVIGFVHSDDFLADPSTISKLMLKFKTGDIDGVYGNLQYVDQTNPDKVIRAWKSQPFRSNLLQHGWMPAHPTLFLKKEVYEKHGEFNLNFKIAADYDFMLRVLQDHSLSFSYLPQVITKMRMGGASNGSLKNIMNKSREDYKVMKTNGLTFPMWGLLAKNLSKLPQFFFK